MRWQHNGATFLEEQFASILLQTLLPAEMVVCDDRSSDETVRIVEDFARTAPFPVRLELNAKNIGHADNFLKAVSLCRSPLVAYCDQDDVWSPEKLERGVDRILRDDSLISLHKATVTDQNLNPKDILSQGITCNAVFGPLEIFPHHGLGWGMSLVFRRELLDLIPAGSRPRSPWSPGLLGHDIWTYLLAASLGRVSHIDEELILYRQHVSNSSGTRRMTLLEKLDAARIVPLHRYRGNRDYYADASACFAVIAQGGGPYAMLAKTAANTYAEMAATQTARLTFYKDRSLLRRAKQLRAYAKVHRPAKASLLKDTILGVFRLGRLVNDKA